MRAFRTGHKDCPIIWRDRVFELYLISPVNCCLLANGKNQSFAGRCVDL